MVSIFSCTAWPFYKHRLGETFCNSRNNWNQLFFAESDVKPYNSAHCCSGSGLTLHLAFKLLSCSCIMTDKSFFFLFLPCSLQPHFHIYLNLQHAHMFFPVFILINVLYLTKTMSPIGTTNTSNYSSELFIQNASNKESIIYICRLKYGGIIIKHLESRVLLLHQLDLVVQTILVIN